jgi:transcriptional regulator with XRE-family HTH domain
MSTAPTEAWVPADTLAARLILVRHQLGLSQREAAEQAGVGFGAWQSWESGRAPRNAVTVLAQVADRLRLRRDWLLFGGPLVPSGPAPGDGRDSSAGSRRGFAANTVIPFLTRTPSVTPVPMLVKAA